MVVQVCHLRKYVEENTLCAACFPLVSDDYDYEMVLSENPK